MANSQLTIDSIIKKYEQRQEKLTHSLVLEQINPGDTQRDRPFQPTNSGIDTPQFSSSTNRKEITAFHQETIEKTHKKRDSDNGFHQGKRQNYSQSEYERLLSKLDQTEEKLARSEKNYAEIWRKYELLLQQSKKSEKSIQLQQRLRGKQSNELQHRLSSLEKENSTLKQCIRAKEANLTALRGKLQQKNQRIIEAERLLQTTRTELQLTRDRLAEIQQGYFLHKGQGDEKTSGLRSELAKFQELIQGKQRQKRQLLLEMEKIHLAHREELEVLRLSYGTVEEQYKQWIEDCKNEKLKMIQQYEQKIKDLAQEATRKTEGSADSLTKQLVKKTQQIQQITEHNILLVSELQRAKEDLSMSDQIKQELIVKVSSLENSILDKLDLKSSQEEVQRRLQDKLKQEETKNKELHQRYNNVNAEYQQLKEKQTLLLQQLQSQKSNAKKQIQQTIKIKKEIALCKEQLEKSRNSEMSLSNKLNQTISLLKKKNQKSEESNHQLMTQLMAQRLQSARLRQQVEDTKTYLKREYELSLQNTRKQLQTRIKEISNARTVGLDMDLEKEELYLQLRQLQRRYQLLASEVVSVDEVLGIAGKAQRRYLKGR